jgi:O-6-methylguanine DNA methyltransferase
MLVTHAPATSPNPQLRLVSDFTMAAIPTAWGNCAVVWKNHERESFDGFAHPPKNALLSRIYTPGTALPQLRQQILRTFLGCREVLPTRGTFRPETVPDWFPRLHAFLQYYYSAALHLSQSELADHWSFWRPRLAWDQLTPFQRRVLEIVATIPSASHLTYGAIARLLNKPQAARAVGNAVGKNPWPVLIPCHRVLGANRALTGFSAPGGVLTKQKMLDLEAG